MPNDNRQMGTTHQRAILYELKCIKKTLEKMLHVLEESRNDAQELLENLE
jgi:hypothetical protein